MTRHLHALLSLLSAVVGLTACEGRGDDSGDPVHDVTISFAARLAGVDAVCGAIIPDTEHGAAVADARMYVSNLQMRVDGAWEDVVLEQDGKWQHDNVALLDFEDGSGACADSGNTDMRSFVDGTIPHGTYDGLRFDVGVPAEHNHVDSATAPAPLNATGMFWVWQSGYKFVRVDFAVPTDPASRWNTHIGSTNCVSDAPTAPPDEPCGRPNRATIALDAFDPFRDIVVVDLATLVGATDVALNTDGTPPGCMTATNEPSDCAPSFDALGLNFETGQCTNGCGGQTLFTVEAVP